VRRQEMKKGKRERRQVMKKGEHTRKDKEEQRGREDMNGKINKTWKGRRIKGQKKKNKG
jgi:phosphoenolpyruvate carboxylase